jgi:hypothetical protein
MAKLAGTEHRTKLRATIAGRISNLCFLRGTETISLGPETRTSRRAGAFPDRRNQGNDGMSTIATYRILGTSTIVMHPRTTAAVHRLLAHSRLKEAYEQSLTTAYSLARLTPVAGPDLRPFGDGLGGMPGTPVEADRCGRTSAPTGIVFRFPSGRGLLWRCVRVCLPRRLF